MEEVFSKATVAALCFKDALRSQAGLNIWNDPSASPHLPSWVIDFTAVPIEIKDLQMHDDFLLKACWGRFDAAAGSPALMRRIGTAYLNVAAFFLDEIHVISPPFGRFIGSELSIKTVAAWGHCIELAKQFSISDLRVWQTVCIDRGPARRRFTESHVKLLADEYMTLMERIANGDSENDLSNDSRRDWTSTTYWCMLTSRLMLTHRFFITTTGCLGLAHRNAAVGDRIAIFASRNMPFIIRPVDAVNSTRKKTHQLVGSCYLEGKSMCLNTIILWMLTIQAPCTGTLFFTMPCVCRNSEALEMVHAGLRSHF